MLIFFLLEARMVGKIALELQGYMVVSMASGDVAQKMYVVLYVIFQILTW